MGMFPNTEAGRKEAWQREYLTAHGGLQPGSEAAKVILRQADAQAWVKQKMKETTKRGTPKLPDAVKQYAERLGKAGLDYRAISIARTETAAMLADEQKDIARNSNISDGKMDWVMDRGRDAYPCRCEELANGGPYDVDNMVDKKGNEIDCPLHPNCTCELRPHLKTDAEIMASLKAEMKDDSETIQGTDEQRDLLERICPHCGRALNSKLPNAKCPYCGEEIDVGNSGDDEEKRIRENERKAKEVADRLYANERWIQKPEWGERIYVSEHRKSGSKTNFQVELHDAKILRDMGNTVYLPEENTRSDKKQGDAIVNGMEMEFKNQKGKSERTLKDHFLDSREQAPNVFINLEKSPLSKRKILSTIYKAKNSTDYPNKNCFPEGGIIILKIQGSNELVYLHINDL
jgi:uncharacterized Zn finger protein (UPF0148 family)